MKKFEEVNKKNNKFKKTYGPHHFKITSKEQKLFAIGNSNLDKFERILLINEYEKFYEEIAIPEIDDWLWEHNEGEQTFNQYTRQIINQPTKMKNTIYIVNLEGDEFISQSMEVFKLLLENYYPSMKVKDYTGNLFSKCSNLKQRQSLNYIQSHASVINNLLNMNKPSDCLYFVALTSNDLYHDSSEFLYGLANDGTGCCVISVRRFCDEIKELNLTANIQKVIIQTILHEVGHLFGLAHCIYFKCNMNGGNNLKETLAQPFEICPVCVRKLRKVIKFDIKQRLSDLALVLNKIDPVNYKDEIKWYSKRLTYLNDQTEE